MSPQQQETWLQNILREILRATLQDEALRQALIFKGAWILNFQLGHDRHSRDLDATTAPEWTSHAGGLEAQSDFFQKHLPPALRRHFEQQNPVRFSLDHVSIRHVPHPHHPRGWDMLRIRIIIADHHLGSTRGLPAAELEVSAPEKLGPESTEQRPFLGSPARIYTLHRIAGEKLRAYLTSLPEYRAKMGSPRDMRVKDLYDLARILRHRPITDTRFWNLVITEFRLACESRYVDCASPATFKQEWPLARHLYSQDQHLNSIPFEEAETALETLLQHFAAQDVFPLQFPL